MLNQTDQERELYEARRKWQLDYNTGMRVARMEGREEGRQEALQEERHLGQQIGRIHQCERLLRRPPTPLAELEKLSLDELTKLADQLESQILQA